MYIGKSIGCYHSPVLAVDEYIERKGLSADLRYSELHIIAFVHLDYPRRTYRTRTFANR
jgi:hypothetical protein